MCIDCEIACSYCGEDCGGNCPDEETCPLCWTLDNYGEVDDDAWDYCAEAKCDCFCHGDMDQLESIMAETFKTEKVHQTHEEDQLIALGSVTDDKSKQGVFPFLALPTELRNKIYNYVLKLSGDSRKRTTPFLKGTIATDILYTCRQINREARHLPLTINRPSFANAFAAFRFVVSGVAPTQKHLIRSLHIDVQGVAEIHTPPFQYFMVELASMSIKHFSITLRGPISEDWLVNSNCLKTILETLDSLESFDMTVGCGWISPKTKSSVVEALREAALEKSTSPTDGKMENHCYNSRGWIEEPCMAINSVYGVATKEDEAISGKSVTPIRTISPEAVRGLLQRYWRLSAYAEAVDGGLSVKIRLSKALNAAQNGDSAEFDNIEKGINTTLEEQYAIISERRAAFLSEFGSHAQ